MNREELSYFENPPSGVHHIAIHPSRVDEHLPSQLKAPSLSSSPSEADWVSPFTLPPLPSLRGDRSQSDNLKSPDHLRHREGSGAYYAAAWGSPYATPSPRRTPCSVDSARHHPEFDPTSSQSSGSQFGPDSAGSPPRKSPLRKIRLGPTKELRNPLSERPNWLSESEGSDSETSVKEEDKTPTRVAYLDSWGASPVDTLSQPSSRHQVSESLATITPDIFHDPGTPSVGIERQRRQPSPFLETSMADHDSESVQTEDKSLPELPRRTSWLEEDDKALESPNTAARPRPTSMQSFQRPKKKVTWKGKTCIIALPLTDREAAGLPPLITPQEVKQRIEGWLARGYRVDGFELDGLPSEPGIESSGQSRPVYPDPAVISAERKLRHFQVHIPNQAEWESWVNYLKEEKLRALGVSPSNSEAPPSTRSPFSPSLSRVSSGYPALAPSPPIAPSSSASNPLRATSNPFSPSLMSSAGISPIPGSVTSSQFNPPPKPLHGYKPSTAPADFHGRVTSPSENTQSHPYSFGPVVRPNIQTLSSRTNSFSPNHPLLLPNLGEVLSPASQSGGPDVRGLNMNFVLGQGRHHQMPSRGHVLQPSQHTPSPALPPRIDSLARTPDYNESSRTPIEIAHPTPKSHRHNFSVALQREIDEAEAALHDKHDTVHAETPENFEISPRKDATLDEYVNEEPPILRRPETITDERSEIETNPSIAATPMLMDDKNPFVNWQALSDAAKNEPRTTCEPAPVTSKLNVQAKEFDPRAGFSSSNFSFGGTGFAPFGLTPAASVPHVENPPAKSGLSLSHLNADAPTFTPSFVYGAAPKGSPFKFSSATFNVAAPVFNPSRPSGPSLKDSLHSSGEGPPEGTKSIFGNVIIDSGSKVNRRANKAMPILSPNSKDDEKSDSDSTDDEGRPMAPVERQKRARRDDSDGDRSPVFADSAPFNHRRILSEIVNDINVNRPQAETPKDHFDGWAYISADETQLPSTTGTPAQEDHEESRETDSGFTFKNQSDAAMFNDARPPLDAQLRDEAEEPGEPESVDIVREEVGAPVEPTTTENQSKRKPKSSLSALAKPFEFKPSLSSPFPSSSFATPRKSQGLEASRYATSSPQHPSDELMANLSSPADLPHYMEKDNESIHDAENTVEVIEESSDEEEIVEVIEEKSDPDESKRQEDETASEPDKENQFQLDSEQHELEMPRHPLRHQDVPVPSFEEIDAVMKQFEVDPELGIERNDTPVQSTPLVDPRLSANLRSDAPSPSPPRLHDNKAAQSDVSYPPSFGLGIGVHNLGTGREDISDWGDVLPAAEEAKLQLRSQFFDGHVNVLVDGILENRLGPLERTLQTIQQSLALMAPQSKPKNDQRSLSTDQKDSDADDEDDYDAFEGFSSYRANSPMARRGSRKPDKIRAAVADALAAHQPPSQPQPSIDMTEFNAIVREIKELVQQTESRNTQNELKTIVEDVISHHPRLRGSRVQQDHETAETKFRPQIDGLETMLKITKEHADEEGRLRRKAEEEINELKLRLRIAEEEAAQYRESSEEVQNTLEAFAEEKQSYRNLEREVEQLTLKNAALDTTLEEYRLSSDQWRDDIRSERANNQALKRTLQDLSQQLEDQTHSRQTLRAKVERVQLQMTQVVQDLHAEQAEWRQKEHSLLSKLALVQDALDHERRHREKAELELDSLNTEHKAILPLKSVLEHAQLDISRLNELVATLREENRVLDTKAFNLDRELVHAVNSKDAELATSTAKLQAELESAQTQLQNVRADSEAQISRLQSRLDHAELDIEEQKARHDALFAETMDAHKLALQEANERRESALEDQHQIHEKKLNDLRDRHTRELHNSFDNRTRLAHQLNERLALSDDKVKHLESKVADLEERLEITKSAARAAVEAATAKGVNPPTPAPSVVASPPQRAAGASMSFAKGSEVPEKISPQALRESIMVLQDQLQNREQRIEQLEAELTTVDKDMPNKLNQRDTEISWLRELLSVRVDDLEDIINSVSKPDFDRDTVRDAAIRLKANLQMEQQLKERAAGGMTSSFPSLSGLSSYAQSPRALPMAAAAAWGNWRRARDTSIGALSELAANLGNQTPSKSTIGSPASFLSGIITPPGTSQKAPGSNETPMQPPNMRPLAAARAARKTGPGPEARPLRAYNSQPRSLSGRQQEKRPESSQSQSHSPSPTQSRVEPPHTPTQVPTQPSLDLTEDVDDDASPLDGRDTLHLEEAEPMSE